MSELLEQLGVKFELLLAQVISFLLLFFLLKRFAYKPLQELMAKRAKLITKGLEDGEFNEKEREKLRLLKAQIIQEGEKEAREIMSEARVKGQKDFEILVAKAKTKTEELVTEAKSQIQTEKERSLKEARRELGTLVLAATSKILEEKIDEEKDRVIVERVLREIH